MRLPQPSSDDIARLLEVEQAKRAAEPLPIRAARTIDRLANPRRRRALASLAILGLTAYLIHDVWGALKAWDEESGRKTIEAKSQLDEIRKAARETAVALDYARGREKRLAAALYARDGFVLPGLQLQAPARGGAATSKLDDICPHLPKEDVTQAIVACWQDIADQARLAEQSAATAAVEYAAAAAAEQREAFDAVKKALGRAQAAVDRVREKIKLPAAPVATPKTGANTEREAVEHPGRGRDVVASAPGLVSRHEPVWWPYYVFALLMAGVGGWALVRRDAFVIHDRPRFLDALGIWHPLLGAVPDLNSPREVKRFVNRARYYAMRLRSAIEEPGVVTRAVQRLGRTPPAPNVGTSISEATIVGLTALYHVDRTWLTTDTVLDRKPQGARTKDPLSYLAMSLGTQQEQQLGDWPPRREDVAKFLAVVGEFADDGRVDEPTTPSTSSVETFGNGDG